MKLQVVVHMKTNTIELINSENGEQVKFYGQHVDIRPPEFYLAIDPASPPRQIGYIVTIHDIPFEVRND